MFCKPTFAALALLAIMVHPLHAKPEANINISFSVITLDKSIPENIIFFTGKKKTKNLVFERKGRSTSYHYKGRPELSFFEKKTLPDGRKTFFNTGSVTIDPQSTQLLLFFVKNKDYTTTTKNLSPHKWKVIALKDDLEQFPTGTLQTFNASNTPLAGRIGKNEIHLNKYASRVFEFNDISANKGKLELKFATKTKSRYELVYNNIIAFDSSVRAILVLKPPRRKNSLLIDTWLLEEYPKAKVPR